MTWLPGQTGNAKGRPRGPKSELEKLRESVKRIEADETITRKKEWRLYDHFVRQAVNDNSVLTALLKKLVPDLKQIDGTIDSKQLSLLSISLNPEIQNLIQSFLGQMAKLELDKGKPKVLIEGKKNDSPVKEDEMAASEARESLKKK